ncbi:Sodium:neurotransmitter symporter family [Popillia japonica]|uniref:Transporter n=1 Tax=Popillia japonica TaxID=7064 RepID=A0AAW1ICI8_POPJA
MAENEHEKYKKEKWNNSLEFLMSCIAMSVGLGNIWRFPFTAYQNGGGAFLIPYVIILILVGRPLYYLEMCIGQFTSKGNVKSLEAVATVLKENMEAVFDNMEEKPIDLTEGNQRIKSTAKETTSSKPKEEVLVTEVAESKKERQALSGSSIEDATTLKKHNKTIHQQLNLKNHN